MLLHADALALMRALPDKSVDHVITDPPYLGHTHRKQRQGCTGYVEPTRPNARRAQFNRARELGFEPLTPGLRRALAEQFARLARRWVLIFCDPEGVGMRAEDHPGGAGWIGDLERAGLRYVRTCPWVRAGAPQFTGDRPAQVHEAIVVAHAAGERLRWNSKGKRGLYEHDADQPWPLAEVVDRLVEGAFICSEAHDCDRHAYESRIAARDAAVGWLERAERGEVYRAPIVLNRGKKRERYHTAQKPLTLMEELVRDFTDPGELILDPLCGAGTTLLAAQRLGRQWVGCDEEEQCVEDARTRLREEGWQ